MKTTRISVTDAARNFADCVNRVRYQNMTFVLLKNGAPVARLIPDGEKVCRAHDLAKILRNANLPVEEASAWNRDLRAARKILKAPKNRWR
jgi:antitoxin (DNA-binding transcriptional repressor) of toxin-antitoxin stability system